MLNWNSPFGSRQEQPKSRRPKETVKLSLEVLEDRTMLSASAGNPQVFESVASPPAALYAAALTSYMVAEVGHEIQVIDTIEQDVLSDVNTLAQGFYQEVAALEQKWLNLFGISFTASNQVPNNSVMPPVNNISGMAKGSGSGSGSGSSAMTTHHESDQPIHSFAAQPGSGAGNGSSPDSSGSATVYGNVFLDNNGDGIIDHGESGFVGDGVVLYTQSGSPVANTTTDANGNYSITIPMGTGEYGYYYIAVGIPQYDYATIPGYSQINAYGDSAVFELSMGSEQQINAGIRSMNVTTLADDPLAAIPMQITLRDAMSTGNNGPPTTAVTFNADLNGGTISLLAELPPIAANYNIVGPTANPITVNGNDDTGTVFTNDATSEIDNLVIENGEAADGGDVYNSGTLTLNADTVEDGDATSSGGGMSPNGMLPGGPAPGFGVPGYGGAGFNAAGKVMNILGGSYSNNQAGKNGGGFTNYGYVHFGFNTYISYNTASGNGGGIYNGAGGTVTFTGNATIANNKASGNGGGVFNSGTFTIPGNTTINNNTASKYGGGISNEKGATINASGDNNSISNNTALRSGGGVANSGTFTMAGGVISRNSASFMGGGAYNITGKMTLSTVQISGNSAGSGGGGIYVTAGTVTLKDDFIVPDGTAKNQAPTGGGMFIGGGTVNISGGAITGNTASRPAKPGTPIGNGGGIFNYLGSLTIKTNVKIYNNIAKNQGGGMYLLIGSKTTFGPVVDGNPACKIAGNKAGANQGLGAYQQTTPTGQAAIINWIPFVTVSDADDTKENNPGRTGQAFDGP